MSDQDDPVAPRTGDPGGPPPMPSWVKALVIGLLVVVLLAVLAAALLGGEHGPSRHGQARAAGLAESAPALVAHP